MRLIDADALPISFDGHTVSVWKKDLDAAPTINTYEWISVEDRLPEESGRYLCYYRGSNLICPYSAIYKMFNACDDADEEWNKQYAMMITHWMPLPSPPTEKEN